MRLGTAFLSTSATSRGFARSLPPCTFLRSLSTLTSATSTGPNRLIRSRSSLQSTVPRFESSLNLHQCAANMSSSASGADMFKAFVGSSGSSSGTPIGLDIPLAMSSLVQADAVCLDVDSTVINEEGIDVLGEFLGKHEEIAALTKAAMEGGMKFQDALAARLSLLEPSKQQIEACLAQHPLELTHGCGDFIATLHNKGKHVYLVSGGFRIMIEPVADLLKINPATNIVANTIFFQEDGTYAGFDDQEPTSADMGKPKALEQIQKLHNYECMVMIGDGATDAQAKPPAAAFIGFGGVVERQAVVDQSDWFVTEFGDLTRVLDEYA